MKLYGIELEGQEDLAELGLHWVFKKYKIGSSIRKIKLMQFYNQVKEMIPIWKRMNGMELTWQNTVSGKN